MEDKKMMQKSDSAGVRAELMRDLREIIEHGRREAYAAAGQIAVKTYWNIGKRIVEEEQNGEARAQYGLQLIKQIALRLMQEYGSAFSKRNLEYYRQFYMGLKDIEIVNVRVHNLTWTHFRIIMREISPEGRALYANGGRTAS